MIRDFDHALNDVQGLIEKRLYFRDELARLSRSGFSAAVEEKQRQELQEAERRYRDWGKRELATLVDFPPRHIRHDEMLRKFWKEGTYDESVFIMTKFPGNGTDPKDAELERVLQAVAGGVTTAGFKPRVARTPANYHAALWDNVELHLLGCRQGIAIVQDVHLDELNPNLMMEWGWMRAMGKPVLFLVEGGFKNFRADIGGLVRESFSWDDPEATAGIVIGPWLSQVSVVSGAGS